MMRITPSVTLKEKESHRVLMNEFLVIDDLIEEVSLL